MDKNNPDNKVAQAIDRMRWSAPSFSMEYSQPTGALTSVANLKVSIEGGDTEKLRELSLEISKLVIERMPSLATKQEA